MESTKKKRGRPPKKKSEEIVEIYAADPSPAESPESEIQVFPEDNTEVLEYIEDNSDLFLKYAAQVDQAIVDQALGVRIALKVKKVKLLRGEQEYEVQDENGDIWYVYTRPPSPELSKLIRESLRGKPGTMETKSTVSALVIRSAIPGHDEELSKYLCSLPPETLSKYGFSPDELEKIKKFGK